MLEAVFEDEWILVVNKPAGLVVHATPKGAAKGMTEPTLEDLVRSEFARSAILMHRLDKQTTGLVLFAKRREVAGPLTQAIEKKQLRKSYLAVVNGVWPKTLNRVESKLARTEDRSRVRSLPLDQEGELALTTFRLLASGNDRSWVEALLKTGRQHQIRAQCQGVGHPILGDQLYGGGEPGPAAAPWALHAYRLSFRHPKTQAELSLRVVPPDVWQSTWLQGMDFRERWNELFKSEEEK